jgi:hypothetical protein
MERHRHTAWMSPVKVCSELHTHSKWTSFVKRTMILVMILTHKIQTILELHPCTLQHVNVNCFNSVAPEPEGSSLHSQQPATCPYPEPTESTQTLPQPVSLRSILIPSSHLCLSLPRDLFPSGCTLSSPLPCVPHAPPTLFSFILSA